MPLSARHRRRCSSALTLLIAGVAAGSLVLTLPLPSVLGAGTELAWGDTKVSRAAPVTTVNAEVMVLLGTQGAGAGSIDPAIGRMPQLRSPPLSSYNTYHLLDRRTVPLELGRSATYPLANGRVLQVTFVEATGEHAFHVKAAINQPGGSAYLKLLDLTAKANEPFFVGGQSFGGGSLVLAITLRR